jgi:hypothetical protein
MLIAKTMKQFAKEGKTTAKREIRQEVLFAGNGMGWRRHGPADKRGRGLGSSCNFSQNKTVMVACQSWNQGCGTASAEQLSPPTSEF